MDRVGGLGFIFATNSRQNITFRNLFVRNFTIAGSGFFYQTSEQEDTKMIQTTFKLINVTFQDLKHTNYQLSDPPINKGLFINVYGPTHFFINNLTVNKSILYSKKKIPTILII